jgi:hypothetical protein
MDFGVMVCPWPWRRPPSPLPTAHSHDLRRRIQLNNTIYLAIGVTVVLPTINLLAVHVNSSDTEVATGICRDVNLAPAIFRAVNLVSGHPALVIRYALSN